MRSIHTIDRHRAPRIRTVAPRVRAPPAQRHALLIATSYRGSSDWFLPGCDREALRMHKALRTYLGYASDEISMLRNGQATRARILAELRGLMQRTDSLQEVVIYFAGHGVQQRGGGELDGKDECIVAHDLQRIVDDELCRELGRCAPACSLVALFDCCTSATMTDGMPLGNATQGATPRGAHRVVVSACADSAYAYQDRRGRGCLTQAITRELRRRGNVPTRLLSGRTLGPSRSQLQDTSVTVHSAIVRNALFISQ